MAIKAKLPYRLYQRGNVYWAYISFVDENKIRHKFRTTTNSGTYQEAEQFVIEKIASLQKQARYQATGQLPSLTVDEAFTRYYEEKGKYLSLPSQRLTRLIKLKKDLNVKMLEDIKEPQITDFIKKNRQELSNATINRYLFLLSAVLRTAREEWKVNTYPIKPSKFKLKEPAENVKYLKDWDYAQRIIDKAAPHLKPIIYTALYTGLRESNILELKWEEIDFTNKTITIKAKSPICLEGEYHTVPIISQLEKILKEQPKCSDYVFTYKGQPIKSISTAWRNIFYKRETIEKDGKTVIGKRFSKELKDPTLPYTNFHTLRHTAATWILKKTNNLRITKDILGHSNINTTLKYAHVLDDEKRKALDSVFN